MTKILRLDEQLKDRSVKELIKNLSSSDANVKFSSSRVLLKMSEDEPEKIYSCFDDFIKLTEKSNKIIVWTGIIIIGNLAKIDKKKKIEKILPRIFSLLNTGAMITAANTIAALAKIALVRPELKNIITIHLLKVERYNYDTLECKRIAIGHVITAFEKYQPKVDKFVLEFVQKAVKSERFATAKKAEKYLKIIGK